MKIKYSILILFLSLSFSCNLFGPCPCDVTVRNRTDDKILIRYYSPDDDYLNSVQISSDSSSTFEARGETEMTAWAYSSSGWNSYLDSEEVKSGGSMTWYVY